MRQTIRGWAMGAAIMAGMAAAVWAQAAPPLGVSESVAGQRFYESIESGYPNYGGAAAKAFLALPPAGRAAAVTAGFAWMKRHTASTAFTSSYAKRREDLKPTPPEFDGTVDAELKRALEKEAKDHAEALAAMPADQRAQMEAVFKQLAAMNKDPQMLAMRRQGLEMQRADAQRRYEEDLKYWQENVPSDPLVLVARRLQRFLDMSADVDFSAALVTDKNGQRRFASPALESKDSMWKLCFRAGQEAVTEARAQAQAWLKTLPPVK